MGKNTQTLGASFTLSYEYMLINKNLEFDFKLCINSCFIYSAGHSKKIEGQPDKQREKR